jgi:hypothetical protein
LELHIMTTTDFAEVRRLADQISDMARRFKTPSHERGVCNEAYQVLRSLAPTDPLDMPLPCDVTVGHGTHKKGTALRSLVLRMGLLYEDAQRYYQLAAATTGPNDAQHIVSAQGEGHAAIRYAEGFGKGHDAGWAAAMAHMAAHQSLPTTERTTMSNDIQPQQATCAGESPAPQHVENATMGVVTDAMVSRFLGWRLPDSFSPDCFISFNRERARETGSWPIGTNLLDAQQARAMLEFVLQRT